MLGKQLHLSSEKVLARQVIDVKNDREMIFRKKPMSGTGFWTSTWQEEERGSEWVDYARGIWGIEEKYWFLLTPAIDARLYIIDSYEDLVSLVRRFPLAHPIQSLMDEACLATGFDKNYFTGIDFERVAEVYDGLHLTSRAESHLHLSYPLDMNSWDVESTLWFRWVFTDVERIEVPVSIGGRCDVSEDVL